MRSSFLAVAILAVAALAACSSPAPTSVTVQVGQQCEPINQYDTRCEQQVSRSAAPRPSGPITLTRPAHITYEIHPGPSGDRATLVSWLAGPNPRTDVEKTRNHADDLPFRVEVDVPTGTKPWLRWGHTTDATCRVLVDGQDVTLRLKAPGSGLYECGAGSQP